MTVTITVTDDNDHAPSCEATPFAFSAVEDNTNAILLGSVSASDLDIGDNMIIRYSLIDLNQPFTIISTTVSGVTI